MHPIVKENNISSDRASNRVLFVISKLEIGGAEVFLVDLISYLVKTGFKCAVFSLKGRGPIASRLEEVGCVVLPVLETSLIQKFNFLGQLNRAIKRWQPDIVQGWMYHGNLAASLANLKTNMTVVWSIHHSLANIGHEKLSLRIVILVSRLFSLKTKMIHYCSNTSAQQHADFGFSSSRQVVIPNGFDCERFRPEPSAKRNSRLLMGLDSPQVRCVIAHIGRYHPMKDHKNFLEAASIVARKRKDVYFVLLGDGVCEENTSLSHFRDCMGLKDRAVLLGRRDDIPELLHGIDLMSTSSAWGEAFPLVLGEAMACGIPCVATDIGDCGFLVGDAGIIVPPLNPEALSGAWIDLLSESEEALLIRKNNARQRVVENFNVEHIAMRFIVQYERVAR